MFENLKDKYIPKDVIGPYKSPFFSLIVLYFATTISTRAFGVTAGGAGIHSMELNLPTILVMFPALVICSVSLKPLYDSNKDRVWKLFIAVSYILLSGNTFLLFSGGPFILVFSLPISAGIFLLFLSIVLLKSFWDNR